MLCTIFFDRGCSRVSILLFFFHLAAVSVPVLTLVGRQYQIAWLQVSVQTFSQAFASAKEQLARSLLK